MSDDRRFTKMVDRQLGFFGKRAYKKQIRKGLIVNSIKVVRNKTGLGLKEAKRFVDIKLSKI